MPLPELVKKGVEKRLSQYCGERIPAHVRQLVKLDFKFRGNTITLIEYRPYFKDPKTWTDNPVAQFRYDAKGRRWNLYYPDRNGRWHNYFDLDSNPDFEVLLREVDEDPTGIFWG